MRTVSLVNRRRAMLPPIHVPELGLVGHVIGTNERNGKTGVVGRRKVQQDLPKTITLCALGTEGDRMYGLPESVAYSPEVIAAKARGDIDVILSAAPVEEDAPVVEEAAPAVSKRAPATVGAKVDPPKTPAASAVKE